MRCKRIISELVLAHVVLVDSKNSVCSDVGAVDGDVLVAFYAQVKTGLDLIAFAVKDHNCQFAHCNAGESGVPANYAGVGAGFEVGAGNGRNTGTDSPDLAGHAKLVNSLCCSGRIVAGCEMLGMEVRDVAEICIEGMKEHAEELGLLGTEA